MGAADVVPGVSGGTIAFITGIYEKLVGSISNIDWEALKLLFSGKIKTFLLRINAGFLILILLGIITSVLSLAKIIKYLLDNEPVYIWSFFFGLIVASAYVVGKKVKNWDYFIFFSLLIGAVVAYFITGANVINMPDNLFYTFLAGAIAIIAMILPGISGSFLLVIMNKYDYIIGAVSSVSDFVKVLIKSGLHGDWASVNSAFQNAQFLTIIIFMIGALIGLISFAKVLTWLFKRYHDITIAFLTGFLIGSLNKVWPWKEVLSYRTDRHGNLVPLSENNMIPNSFSSEVFFAIGLIFIGFLLVYLIEKFSGAEKPEA